jgi:hypothetical protein
MAAQEALDNHHQGPLISSQSRTETSLFLEHPKGILEPPTLTHTRVN